MDLPEVSEVRVLRVQPGDVVVLRSQSPLTHEDADRIAERARSAFGTTKVVVLDCLDIDVLRQEG